MNCLVELLVVKDRLTLVTFDEHAKRLMPLMKVNLVNKPRIYEAIKEIYADGGTNITAGMEVAFKIL